MLIRSMTSWKVVIRGRQKQVFRHRVRVEIPLAVVLHLPLHRPDHR